MEKVFVVLLMLVCTMTGGTKERSRLSVDKNVQVIRHLQNGMENLIIQIKVPFEGKLTDENIQFFKQLKLKEYPNIPQLHLSVFKNDLETAKRLIGSGENVNAVGKDGFTSLHVAVHFNRTDFVHLLVNSKADVNAEDNIRMRPLTTSIISNRTEIVKMLLDGAADTNLPIKRYHEGPDVQLSDLKVALSKKNVDIVRLLTEAGAKIDGDPSDEVTPLMVAVMVKFHDGVKLLLDKKATVDKLTRQGISALSIALHLNDTGLVKLLLGAGADPNLKMGDKKVLPLITAYQYLGCHEIVEALINAGADVNAESMDVFPLMLAIHKNDTDGVNMFIRAGADVDKRHDDVNCLWLAIQVESPKIVRLLLEAGADPDAKANNASMIFHGVLKNQNSQLLQLLIEAGAEANVHCCKNRSTPLQWAVHLKARNNLLLLLNANASVNDVDEDGYTALHMAAFMNDVEATKLLLQFGADQTIATNDGVTPIMTAIDAGSRDVAELLINRMTDEEMMKLDSFIQQILTDPKRRYEREEL